MQDTAAGGAGMPAVYETVVSAGNADDHIAGITGLSPPGFGRRRQCRMAAVTRIARQIDPARRHLRRFDDVDVNALSPGVRAGQALSLPAKDQRSGTVPSGGVPPFNSTPVPSAPGAQELVPP